MLLLEGINKLKDITLGKLWKYSKRGIIDLIWEKNNLNLKKARKERKGGKRGRTDRKYRARSYI